MGVQCHYCKRDLPEPGVDVIVEYIDSITCEPVPSCQDCRIERDLPFFRVRDDTEKKKKK